MSDASVNTPYNRMAMRKAATHFGAGYRKTNHGTIREMIYTAAALAPFAVGMVIKEPNKRFTTLRSIAVAESVGLLILELCMHHGRKPGEPGTQGQENEKSSPKFAREQRHEQPRLKPQYQAMVDAMERAAGKTVGR